MVFLDRRSVPLKGGCGMKKIGICLMVVLSFILVGNTVYDFRMNSGGTDGRIQLLMKPGGIPM